MWVPLLRPDQAARARLHRLSARNLGNTGRPPERIRACSGRLFRRLVLRSRGMYLVDPPALRRQFSRLLAVAVPLPQPASWRPWPNHHRPKWRFDPVTQALGGLPGTFVRAAAVLLSRAR